MSRPVDRVPLAPLVALARIPLTEVAARTGTDYRTLMRWQKLGIPASKADRMASKLGYHELNVWPELGIDPRVPCPHCETMFVPVGRQKWCRPRCRHDAWEERNRDRVREAGAAWHRTRYQSDPEARAAKVAAVAAYRREVARSAARRRATA